MCVLHSPLGWPYLNTLPLTRILNNKIYIWRYKYNNKRIITNF